VTSVVVIGQGYVGLPLAVAAARAGMDVTGVDLDKRRIDALNAAKSPVGDVDDAELAAVLESARYKASTEFDSVAGADVVVLCVPTPYRDSGPDLSHIEAAAASIAPFLKRGALVILESTTYPGTTEELLRPALEAGSGLVAGGDFHLVFSPERIDPGNSTYGLGNTPKIVGGLTEEGTRRAADFYGAFVDTVVPVSDPKTAEMAKLLENTFRHINIALVNELAILSQDLGVDIWEVINAAASKPFGFMPFYPGPGVGGHCIPVDPLYLSWRVRQFGGAAKFIELARDVNAAMPAYCVTRVQDLLNERGIALRGARVLVLGVAYKADINDMRESPALPVIEGLLRKGGVVDYHDPHVPELTVGETRLESIALSRELLADAEVVILLTPHKAIDLDLVVDAAPLVFDTRSALRGRGGSVVYF
jgi:UDP-N-acetyl-D-glucosamine dehydrogenase